MIRASWKLAMTNISAYALIGFLIVGIILTSLFIFTRIRKTLTLLTAKITEQSIQLHDEHNRFETIFEQSGTGIALVSLEGNFTRVNKALCDLLGYSETDMLKMDYQSSLSS